MYHIIKGIQSWLQTEIRNPGHNDKYREALMRAFEALTELQKFH